MGKVHAEKIVQLQILFNGEEMRIQIVESTTLKVDPRAIQDRAQVIGLIN